MNKINHFNEHKKVRIASPKRHFLKHEVTKLICCMFVLDKLKADKVYTEFKIGERKADVYFEIKSEKYAIEVQNKWDLKYQELAETYYLNRDITPVVIPLKDIPDSLEEIWSKLFDYFSVD